MSQELMFYASAFLITICSVMVVTNRNPVVSAIYLVGDLFLLAAVYASLDAHFVAAIQVLVYAGAIVVLFMFVIMLLNLGPEGRAHLRIPAPEFAVLILTVIGFMAIGTMLLTAQPTGVGGDLSAAAIAADGGNTLNIAKLLFTKFLWPFEISSILILLAVIAAIVIAKKDKKQVVHG